jgi:hypothetical protein
MQKMENKQTGEFDYNHPVAVEIKFHDSDVIRMESIIANYTRPHNKPKVDL